MTSFKTPRDILVNLLTHPPCPECGAYGGMLFEIDSHMDFLFGECESEYCLDTYAWEVTEGEKIRVVLRGGNK